MTQDARSELPGQYDPHAVERKWQDSWEREKLYAFEEGSSREVFSIDTPPPTVSGKMHMGHAFSYSQQDFIARYQRMLGKNVFYPWGFDDNGLATERFVEKKCKVRATQMSRKEFQQLCLTSTKEAEEELKRSWQSLGISPDFERNYRTVDDWCIATSQRSFLELYAQGREYRKEAPTIWCPECRTAIAQVELEDRELESSFNDIAFAIGKEKAVIATTRPELLPACVAVFVHPDDQRYRTLVGKTVQVPLFGQKVPILADVRADPQKGTGMVMCCTFGDQTDMEWWKAHSLPLRICLTLDGKMNTLAGKYAGLPLKEARKAIIEDLRASGALLAQRSISHMVNVHERCSTEIEFLVTKQWFIRVLDLKDELLKAGRELVWRPEHMRHRYENWITGLQWDWCISRQRYFGVPFPVWYCRKCQGVILAKELPVDPLTDKAPACACGSTDAEPERDVLDTWATSSLTPQIALQWREDDAFFNKMYPMSLRPQAHDIITFWLFNTMVKGLLHSGKVPWSHAMISGWALDQHGKKMSKSRGNVIEPLEMLRKFSADSLRYWAASSKLGEDLPFQEKELVAGKKFVTKLWNASRFVLQHLQGYSLRETKLTTVDRWLLHRLQGLIEQNTKSFELFEYSRVRADTEQFFWHVYCDNYLELVKGRLYADTSPERDSALFALSTTHLALLKMLAPLLPHITEEVHHLGFGKGSIHVSSWPKAEGGLLDEEANRAGELLIAVVGGARKAKNEKALSLGAELDSVTVGCSPEERAVLQSVEKDLLDVTRAKRVTYQDAKELIVTITPADGK